MDRKARELAEDAAPVALRVAPGLWLGNLAAACDPVTLGRSGITQSLNLAVNADVPPLTLADGTVVRRAKIGLIDGPGNMPEHLLAAVCAIGGMLAQAAPGKPSYPDHRPGDLLVHCRGGRSRSVTVLALYLAVAATDAAWEFSLEQLRAVRGLGPEHPEPELLRTAGAVWPVLSRIGYRPATSAAR